MTKGEQKPRKNPDRATHPSERPSLSNEALEGVGGGLLQAAEALQKRSEEMSRKTALS